jgi:hypothetical protein
MAHQAGANRDTPGFSVLRAVTAEEARAGGQKRSAEAMRRGEGSGYRGVSWNKVQHEWTAQLNAHGRTHYLGRFDMPLDAAKAYDAAARRELGPSAKVRPSRVGLFTNIYIYG